MIGLEIARVCHQLSRGNVEARTALMRTVLDDEHGVDFLDEVTAAGLTGDALAGLWELAGREPRPFATLVWHEATKVKHGRRAVS